jgi:hypothetical protein
VINKHWSEIFKYEESAFLSVNDSDGIIGSYNINLGKTKIETGKYIIRFKLPFSSVDYEVYVKLNNEFHNINIQYQVMDESELMVRFINYDEKKRIYIENNLLFESSVLSDVPFCLYCWK